MTILLSQVPEAKARPLYEVFGKNGIVTFTFTKPKGGQRYRVVKAKNPRFSRIRTSKGGRSGWSFRPRKSQYDEIIKSKSKAVGVHPALTKAVVHVESAFRVRAKSPMGATGLMQLMPQTAKRFGVKNAYSAEDNIRGGVKYLRWLIDHFDGRLDHVLAGYNAGEGAVKKYNGIPPYKETREYVKRVKKAFAGYKKAGFL